MTIEFRSWNPDEAEVRAVGDGMTFTGYAARFDSRSEYLGFYETIAPGAFTRTLKARNEVKAFLNHNTDHVLGSTRGGTLRLTQDDKGLLAEIDLPDTEIGRSISLAVRRQDISGMSFGFNVPKGGDAWNADGSERTLKEIALAEVSPVTGFPAYRATSASVRSLTIMAHRYGTEADLLDTAVGELLAGERITEDSALLLRGLIDQMTDADPEAVAEEIVPDEARVPLSLLGMKLDLLAKSLNL